MRSLISLIIVLAFSGCAVNTQTKYVSYNPETSENKTAIFGNIEEMYSNGFTGDHGVGSVLETIVLLEREVPGHCIDSDKEAVGYAGPGTDVSDFEFNLQVSRAETDLDDHVSKDEANSRWMKTLEIYKSKFPDCNSPEYQAYLKKVEGKMKQMDANFGKSKEQRTKELVKRKEQKEKEVKENRKEMEKEVAEHIKLLKE